MTCLPMMWLKSFGEFYAGSFQAAPDLFLPGCVNWINEETNKPVLRRFGHTYYHHANTHLKLADGRWFRCPVEGRTPPIVPSCQPLILRARPSFAIATHHGVRPSAGA